MFDVGGGVQSLGFIGDAQLPVERRDVAVEVFDGDHGVEGDTLDAFELGLQMVLKGSPLSCELGQAKDELGKGLAFEAALPVVVGEAPEGRLPNDEAAVKADQSAKGVSDEEDLAVLGKSFHIPGGNHVLGELARGDGLGVKRRGEPVLYRARAAFRAEECDKLLVVVNRTVVRHIRWRLAGTLILNDGANRQNRLYVPLNSVDFPIPAQYTRI